MNALLVLVPLALVLILNLPLPKKWLGIISIVLGLAGTAAQAALVFCPHFSVGQSCNEINQLLNLCTPIDALTRITLLAIAVVTFMTFLASATFIKDRLSRSTFNNILFLALAGMNGITLARDLFSMYVYLEVAAVSAFILIAFNRERASLEGAFKYFMLSALATALFISGIGLVLLAVGSVSFASISNHVQTHGTSGLLLFASLLIICAFFIKGGMVPFHGWVPDAYAAAVPSASVLLAGMISKAGGVYTLIRVARDVFGISAQLGSALLVLGMLSILVGALLALVQSDFRRMLAYSSISQVGYIVLGLGAANPLAIAGAALHLFNHGIFKSLLFINAASVEEQTKTAALTKLRGLGHRLPVTSATSIVAMLSTAGVPPFSGFWSKLMIILGVWQAGHTTLAALALLASTLTLGYFVLMQRALFFGEPKQEFAHVKECGLGATLAVVLLALLTTALGLSFPFLFETFLVPVKNFL